METNRSANQTNANTENQQSASHGSSLMPINTVPSLFQNLEAKCKNEQLTAKESNTNHEHATKSSNYTLDSNTEPTSSKCKKQKQGVKRRYSIKLNDRIK